MLKISKSWCCGSLVAHYHYKGASQKKNTGLFGSLSTWEKLPNKSCIFSSSFVGANKYSKY